MKTNKLFELLTYVDGVRTSKWKSVCNIVDVISKSQIVEKKWNDSYKNNNEKYYPLDLSNINTWSTYDDECIDIKFNIVENKLHCKVKIYDGRLLNGEPIKLRFTAHLILPDTFIHDIEHLILYKFDKYAETAYDEYLQSVKDEWIEKFKQKIFEE